MVRHFHVLHFQSTRHGYEPTTVTAETEVLRESTDSATLGMGKQGPLDSGAATGGSGPLRGSNHPPPGNLAGGQTWYFDPRIFF